MNLPQKEMTALNSFVPANEEQSPKPNNSLPAEETYLKKNLASKQKLSRLAKAMLSGVDLISASEIEPTKVKWLCPPYLPQGKVSAIVGDPGDGKSTLVLTIAAALTRGEPLPFSENTEPFEPITVIYQTTEDDLADTVVPRFIRAGGVRERLVFIKEDKDHLTFSDDRIRTAIELTGAKFLVLDPISAYIGDINLNAANEVRPQFNHLIEICKDTGCTILLIGHMNKGEGLKALYRMIGSIDSVGAVRSVLAVLRDPDDQKRRYLAHAKSNLGPLGPGIVFSIDGDGIHFEEQIEATADDLFTLFASTNMGRPDKKTQSAMTKIREMLEDGEYHPASECEKELQEAGFKQGTIKKAKKLLGVFSEKPLGIWSWKL